ncbi:MAG: lytic murein transglycosylase [Sediminimonas qiaohouensis]|uniref:Lytic murein transglycosylase n=1 Tax=Sediminimonas qiaohouensis TaxID=552061 RepID=A0A7C9HCQ2_9RHOB|nr:lytic murein transglycosylase [Sediminimonas qiaohouensis]MTJ05465.1 lytic murein transglycosylase [Sediminimonas qiaohouensis]
MRISALIALSLTLAAAPAFAKTPCGGSFSSFVADLKQEAQARGHDRATVERFFASVRQDAEVLRADRAQGFFQKPFTEFARSLISSNRMQHGQANARKWDSLFTHIEESYGVSRGILLAFWAFETDYGGFQGNTNTRDALVTLAHDCRRPHLFRPQVFDALTLFSRGDLDPERTTGAWAGEVGMVQMLPSDIIENGVDGDGDGHVSLKTSPPDALMSGAKMLRSLGWRAGEPWLQEVQIPASMDWSQSGIDTTMRAARWQQMGVRPRSGSLLAPNLPASLILPQGHKGPAFLAYPNFNVLFEWNQSFTYVLTAAYFATRLEGAPVFDPGNPDPGLGRAQMKQLQRKLAARGHDVGGVDGILGAGTRAAVQAEQARLGLPADAWPTPALLNRL